MPVLNMYIVHNLNGLDAYTLCTVDEQDSVVARHKRTNYMQAIACVLYSYTACNIIRAYFTHMQLTNISQNFLSDSTSTRNQISSLN